jgi:hypothetical protein
VIPESAPDDFFLPDAGLRHVLSGSAITSFHVFRNAWVVLRGFCGVLGAFAATLLFRWLVPSLPSEAKDVVLPHVHAGRE